MGPVPLLSSFRSLCETSRSGTATGNIDTEEAMKMLQAIRDLMRRMQKLRETQRSHPPVENDW